MNPNDIRFLNFLSLRGPSMWTYRPVLEVWVDIGDMEDYPSNILPGFVERLCAWLPTLSEHRCSYDEPGGFIKRLHEGTWPAHILEHVTLELQNLAGMPGGFGRARETGVRGLYKLVVSAWQEDLTRICLDAARELVIAAIEDTPFDVASTIGRLKETAGNYLLGPSTACIVDAATSKERRIPAIRLSADNLVQLGYGSLQRRIWTAETDRTGAIARGIAQDPDLTHRLLKSCGLPVPETSEESPPIDGVQHRLLVVGGSLVAAARLDAGANSSHPPNAGADVTDHVHPSTAAAACLAARVIGLDIAGVDIVTNDLALPLTSQGGLITGVRAGPGLVPHLQPTSGEPRPVGQAVVNQLFPDGCTGRIPVVGITGSNPSTSVAHLVTEFLRLSGRFTGLACGDGLFLNQRRVESGDCGNWQSATRVLMNRSVDAAVIENGAEVILGQGLAYDRCLVGVVTGIDPTIHYRSYHIENSEQVFRVFRTQVDVVLPNGVAVLHAADPMVADMEPLCDGEVIYFAIDAAHPVIAAHGSRGGKAVTVREGFLALSIADEETRLLPLSEILFIKDDATSGHLEAMLAAVGAAWALGIALHVIRTGLETFSNKPVDDIPPAALESNTPYSIVNIA